jgi:hypothetical protein
MSASVESVLFAVLERRRRLAGVVAGVVADYDDFRFRMKHL